MGYYMINSVTNPKNVIRIAILTSDLYIVCMYTYIK